MHVIHVTSELAPIAKVGGLADVVFGLARATQKLGHTVEIILPKYDTIDYSLLSHLKPELRELWSFENGYSYHNTVWSAEIEGLKLHLLEPHHPAYYFSRGAIYGFPDDVDRFLYFSRLCLEYLLKSEKKPDLVHLHDWPTAVIAPLYREMFPAVCIGRTMLTIHNLEHQGKCSPHNLTKIGLHGEEYLTPQRLQDPLLPDHVNLLKGGLIYSDRITTVSPTYEKEIQTREGGFGLDQLLIELQPKLKGILNGIDTDYWNPATDPLLAKSYSTTDVKKGKQANKTALQKRLNLKSSKGPLVCSIGRLVKQKGPALITYALKRTLEKGGQFVLIGSTPDPAFAVAFKNLQAEFMDNPDVAIHLEYDEPLAHLTYAAADMIVIPSLFEPCGLTQMIALAYGTIPIVRKTGGLADTVFDETNGFVFDHPNTASVDGALDRAFSCYKNKNAQWASLIERGIKTDYSWNQSAKNYACFGFPPSTTSTFQKC